MKDIIKIATALAFFSYETMNLPKLILAVRKAQIKQVQESKASKWPKAMTLKSRSQD